MENKIIFHPKIYLTFTVRKAINTHIKNTIAGHDCQRQVVKLVTFAAILVDEMFFPCHGNQNGCNLHHRT